MRKPAETVWPQIIDVAPAPAFTLLPSSPAEVPVFKLPCSVADLRLNCPALHRLFKKLSLANEAEVQNFYLNYWVHNGIKVSKWLAAFGIKRMAVCMKLNNPAGYGCGGGSRCTWEHICLLCGEEGHGMYQSEQKLCDQQWEEVRPLPTAAIRHNFPGRYAAAQLLGSDRIGCDWM